MFLSSRRRRLGWTSALVTVAVVVAGCGDDADSAVDVRPMLRVLQTFDAPGSTYNVVRTAIQGDAVRCVRDAGYPEFEGGDPTIVGGTGITLPTISGRGASTIYEQSAPLRAAEAARKPGKGGEDRDDVPPPTLTRREEDALDVMYGSDPAPITWNLPVFGKYGYTLGGCYETALRALVENPKDVDRWMQATFVVDNLASAVVGHMLQDDDFVDAEQAWSECMVGDGWKVEHFFEGLQQAVLHPEDEHGLADSDARCRSRTDLPKEHARALDEALQANGAELESYVLDFERINAAAAKRIGS